MAEASGAHRLWLITTNDNVDALRFYQRRGYRLARVDAGAVDRSRAALKPAIPEIGAHGIPLRDELELELLLGDAPESTSMPDAPTLLALELALARRDEAAIPGGYEAVLAPDFLEIGSSGRLWTRAEILEALHAEPPNPSITIESFEIADLGPDVVLATLRHSRHRRRRRPGASKPPQLDLGSPRRPLAAPLPPGHADLTRRGRWGKLTPAELR